MEPEIHAVPVPFPPLLTIDPETILQEVTALVVTLARLIEIVPPAVVVGHEPVIDGAGGVLTVMPTVPAEDVPPTLLAVYWKLSDPQYPLLGV